MKWSKGEIACKRVYVALFVLEQHRQEFDTCGTLRMDQLRFWVPGASPAQREQEARWVAIQCHNIYTALTGAVLEPGTTAKTAVNKVTKAMSTASTTLLEVAELAEECYVFA